MSWSDSTVSSLCTSWWWLIPVVCIILCMLSCRFSKHHGAGRGWCCGRGHNSDAINELRKEVQDLKERMGSSK
jgi:hypothetical protein